MVWTVTGKLNLAFKGKVVNSEIKRNIDGGNVVFCNVRGGTHWVLAHGYSGDSIVVNDPKFPVTSYALTDIVNGNNAIFALNKI